MSATVCSKAQEEYEDDFEKDLDWLISEEGQSEDQVGLTLSPATPLSNLPYFPLCFIV